VFRGLSVFAGGCTLDAARAVAGADVGLVESLADKSLLRHRIDEAEQDRYWLLETIREFATSRLRDAAEHDELKNRHREYFTTQAARFTDYRFSFDRADSAVFKADRANYRLVLHNAVSDRDADVAVSLVASLGSVWLRTGQVADGYGLMRAALALEGGSPADRARALQRTAVTAIELGDYTLADGFLDEAERMGLDHDDPRISYEVLAARTLLAARLGDYTAAAGWARGAVEVARTIRSDSLELHALRMELSMRRIQATDRAVPDRQELEGCLAVAETLLARAQSTVGEAHVRFELAAIYFGLDRYAESLPHEQFFLAAQDRDSSQAMFSVLRIGITIGRLGGYPTAIALLAAARTRWESEGYEPDHEDARYFVQLESSARKALSDEAYERAVSEGQQMPLEDAIELALSLHAP